MIDELIFALLVILSPLILWAGVYTLIFILVVTILDAVLKSLKWRKR